MNPTQKHQFVAVESLENRRLMHAGHEHIPSQDLSINAGGSAYTTVDGVVYEASNGFDDGVRKAIAGAVANTVDDAIYNDWQEAYDFGFRRELANGTYQVELQFAEMRNIAAGQRVFSVQAEGADVVKNLDVVAAAGGTQRAFTQVVTVKVEDGTLDLFFKASKSKAMVSGIYVYPGQGTVPLSEIRGVTAAVTTTQTSTLPVSQDAGVRGGTYANSNYGSSLSIDVKYDTTASNLRYGYLKFDISSLVGKTVDAVKFRIYGGSSQNVSQLVPVKVSAAGNEWDSATLNFNNRPPFVGGTAGTFNVGPNKQWFEVDVTTLVKNALAANSTTATIAVTGGTQTTSPFAQFATLESGANAAQLVATTTTNSEEPPPPPPPPPPPSDALAQASVYVRGGTNANTHYTTGGTTIELKYSTDLNYVRIGYVRFDISNLVGQPTQPMKLRLWGVNSQADATLLPVNVNGAASDFNADTVTYNTRPAVIGGVLGSFKLSQTGKYYEVDVSSFVQSELAAGKKNVTFALQATASSTPYGKINGFAASSNKPELVAGTVTNPPTPTPTPQPIAWSTRAKLVVKREEAQAFSSGGFVYVLGGYYNSQFQANQRVDRYDPKTNTWKQMNNMPSKMTHAGTAVDPVTGKVWFAGGFIGDFPAPQGTATVRVYNPATDSWSTGPSLPEGRGAGGAAIIGRTLYFFGGSNANRSADRGSTWSLDLDNPNATWQTRADMPNARNHFGYATVGGKIYVIGGQVDLEEDSVNQNQVDVYDPTTNTWSNVAMLPKPMSHFHATTSVYKNRYILTAGGENPHNTARSEVFLFDTVTNKWSALTSLPQARRAAAGAIVGDTYVVTGGYLRSLGHAYDVYAADLTKLALP